MSRNHELDFKELVKADVITAVLEETGVDYLLYGRDALKRYRDARQLAERTGRPCRGGRLVTVRVVVRNADEMEELAYIVELIKIAACPN